MTPAPLGTHDRYISHPLHFDLRGYGFVIPSHARTAAFVSFESLQFIVFAWATFFWDTLPGMRRVISYVRALRAETATASLNTRLAKIMPLVVVVAGVAWLILETLETVRDVFPPGLPRFCAATAFSLSSGSSSTRKNGAVVSRAQRPLSFS